METSIWKRVIPVATALLATLSLSVLNSAVAAEQPQPIKIGIVTFLSGPAAGPFGVVARNAAEITAEDLNNGTVPAPYDTKGFGGTPIKLTIVDEAGGPTSQVSQYRNLVQQQGVDLVIGYISSADCLAVAPVAEKLQKLTVLFDCGTPRIFQEASYKYVFRTGATEDMDNVAAAMYLKDQGVKVDTYAGINQNYAWGQDSWKTFQESMKQVYPDAKMVMSQMPKFMSGQYGAAISALLSSDADVLHSSFWGSDLNGLILQGKPRGLFSKSKVVLTAADPLVYKIGDQIPDGTILGARGPFDMFAPDNDLNKWLRKVYTDRYGIPPTYEAYKMAQAIFGVKTAYEKAKADNDGVAPDQAEIIEAFEHLTWEGPGGKVTLARGEGHQAVQGTAYGTVAHKDGKLTVENVVHFSADQVSPPVGTTSKEWIESGFEH